MELSSKDLKGGEAASPEKDPPTNEPEPEPPVLELEAREFEEFEHHFSANEFDPSIPAKLSGLPENATYDMQSHVLKWLPTDGTGGQEFTLQFQFTEPQGVGRLPKVLIRVQRAYTPPKSVSPTPLTLDKAQPSFEKLSRWIQEILDLEISPIPSADRFARLQKIYEQANTDSGPAFHLDFARALRILETGGLTVSDYEIVTESLKDAIERSESRYLPASHLQIYALMVASRFEDAIDRLPDFGKALSTPKIASEAELCLRAYELGQLVAVIEVRASQGQQERLKLEINGLREVLSVNAECASAFRDGLNRIRCQIQQEQSLAQEDREVKVQLTSDKIQSMIDERDKLVLQLEAEDAENKNRVAELEEQLAPVKEKTTALQEKYDEQAEELQELKNDANGCITTREGYIAELEALRIEYDAAITAGNQATASTVETKSKLVGEQIAAEERRGASIAVKLKNKEREMEQTKRKAAPFVSQLVQLDKKWQANRVQFQQRSTKLSTQIRQLDRKISIQQGKPAPSIFYQPSVVEIVPVNFNEQRKFLIESCAAMKAK